MATRNNKSLVVVESPAKARTISRILGSKYDVKASIGHVRDLPKRDLGIQIEDGFLPKYVVPKEKARTVKEIRDAAQKAGNVYLATDPDREGEAIAWHLLEAADLGALPLHRVVFHEITPEAVQEAFEHSRDIDMKLVDAQQARRVLDRLVGYRLRPFLWTDVRRGLSAGRVQSGAVGLITYMRTDSTNVAASAQQETRAYITERFGREFLPASARVFAKKVKGAQEAHEAIRPTHVRREPEAVRRYLNNDQNRLYNLIWQRMVASQMADALFDVTTVDIEGMPSAGQNPLLLRATNTQLQFAGFRQVYIEGRDDDTEEDLGNNPLPALSEADLLRALGFFPEQHFTEPPPRFTEATLIKALEEKGIGRPSTYAPTMSTIQDRGYVEKDGRYLRPSDLGSVVNDLLVEHFQDFVDVGFTAGMEDELDDIANGDRRWQPVVQEFYNPLEKALTLAKETAPKQVETTDVQCPECGKPMLIRWGRRGRFLACSGFPECKGTLPLEGEEQEAPQQTDEQCPECSSPMVIKSGRFGRFLACSRYPECKGRKPFTVTTGVRCPRDAGELLERRSRRGRIFYGCSNYPKCDFTTWTRPLPQPCPNCGGLVTAERDNKAKCTVCNWRGGVVQQAPEPTPIA